MGLTTALSQIDTGMKIEAGKWYMTRAGNKAFVAFIHPGREEDHCIGYIVGNSGIGIWCTNGKYAPNRDTSSDLVEEWKEPVLRPWKDDEIPLGAWYRVKGQTLRKYFGTAVVEGEISIGRTVLEVKELMEYYEHTLDNGKSWHPCGTYST